MPAINEPASEALAGSDSLAGFNWGFQVLRWMAREEPDASENENGAESHKEEGSPERLQHDFENFEARRFAPVYARGLALCARDGVCRQR